MKVKIEFYTKCFGCLYENPNVQLLTWDNGFDDDGSEEYEPDDEDLEVMIEQLHISENITCPNCGEGDSLAFAVEKVNDKPYSSNNDSPNLDDRNSQLEYQTHNKIQEYAPFGAIIFYLKNGLIKVGEVNGVSTDTFDGNKMYFVKTYQDLDFSSNLFEQTEFGGVINYENIELSEINSIEFLMSFEDMHWREEEE